MKRLIEKYKGFYIKPDNVFSNWQNSCINKLGRYEDIEEYCERIEKGDPVYRKYNGKIFSYCDYNSTCDISYSFSKRSIVFHDFLGTFYLKIDDYGKTWAFNKKELENEISTR